jgi:hypothetical protein
MLGDLITLTRISNWLSTSRETTSWLSPSRFHLAGGIKDPDGLDGNYLRRMPTLSNFHYETKRGGDPLLFSFVPTTPPNGVLASLFGIKILE